MSGKSLILGVAVMLAACAPVTPSPTMPNARVQGAALAAACAGRDGWSDAAPPARIHGNTYYVGTCGIAVILVTTPQGHVLIDGATEEAVPSILANIRALGFDPRDIVYIVGSHEHKDHMGGFAALQAATGARVMVSAPARRVLESGMIDADDPQFAIPNMSMRPVVVHDTLDFARSLAGLVIVLSDTGASRSNFPFPLAQHATPGHTSGGTSWTWRSCEGALCADFAYVDSLTAVSSDDYRFADHPERVAPFRATFDRVVALPCDILVTPHPSASDLFPRMSGAEPLVDREACRRLVHTMRARLDARLARESGPGGS